MCTKPSRMRQGGVSLIELVIFIVIIGTALVGILGVMNQTTAHSADPLIYKQAAAIAESLLEEVELHSVSGVEAGAARATWTEAQSYNGYSTATGIVDMQGNAIAGLNNYNVNVAVAQGALHTLAAASAVMITVRVTHPSGFNVEAVGYRANYE